MTFSTAPKYYRLNFNIKILLSLLILPVKLFQTPQVDGHAFEGGIFRYRRTPDIMNSGVVNGDNKNYFYCQYTIYAE
jgi:hypothetical protein